MIDYSMRSNYGLYWSCGDMKKLLSMYESGVDISAISAALGRSPLSCCDKLRSIKTAILFSTGSDEDTLLSIKLRE